MNAPRHDLYAGRGFARRLVELPCELYASSEDDAILTWGTDLSESGMFLETPTVLEPGEDVVVSFRPAVEWRQPEITVFAEVARHARGLRRNDTAPGLGLRFLDLSRAERRALERWMRPRQRVAPGVRRAQSRVVVPVTDHPFAARVSY